MIKWCVNLVYEKMITSCRLFMLLNTHLILRVSERWRRTMLEVPGVWWPPSVEHPLIVASPVRWRRLHDVTARHAWTLKQRRAHALRHVVWRRKRRASMDP